MRHYRRYGHPLTPLEYHILIAVAHRSLYASAIGEEVAKNSTGSLIPNRSAVKAALGRLADRNCVKIVEDPGLRAPRDPRCGQDFGITTIGWKILEQEIKRLERAVSAGGWAQRRKNHQKYPLQI
jgi:hypothetical protein